MLTQVLLAKRLYLEACTFVVRQDAVSSGLTISMLQDAVELYVWTLIKHRNLPAKDQAGFVAHIECLQKSGISVPNAAKLLELNKARVGFKHYGNLPAGSEAKKFQSYVEEFFHLATPEHFGIEFDAISLVDLVANEKVQEHLRIAEQQIASSNFQEAVKELAKAEFLLFAALNSYIPGVEHNLRDADQILRSLDGRNRANAFTYVSDYLGTLREYTLVSLLRLSVKDYYLLRSELPVARRSLSGDWFVAFNRSNYTADECKSALRRLVNLSIQLETFQ
jgi:hypothetical protein